MSRQYGAPKETDSRGRPVAKGSSRERKDRTPAAKEQDPSPSTEIVRAFHKNAAVDSKAADIHHTLGHQGSQASPGDHDHDGGSSKLLVEGLTITGVKSTPASVLPSIIAVLVRLGAKDSTT